MKNFKKSAKRNFSNVGKSVVSKNFAKKNFGAGAGYTIGIEGVPLTRTIDIGSIKEEPEWDLLDIEFDIEVGAGYCDKWETNDYYYGVNSDSGYILESDDDDDDDNGNYITYDSVDTEIEGGVIHCYTEIKNGDLLSWRSNYMDGEKLSQKDLIKLYILSDLPKKCDLYGAFGGGWSHTKLAGDDIVFDRILGEAYSSTDAYIEGTGNIIVGAEITAPNITADIDWFYDHCHLIKEYL